MDKKIIEIEVKKYQPRAVKDYLRQKTTRVMRFVWFIAFRIVRLQFTVFLELKSAFCLVCIVRGLYKTLWLKKVNNYIV